MTRVSQAKQRRNHNKIHASRNRAVMKPTSGNQVSIFPFELVLGTINVTNTGNVADNTIISDYVHYEKVFTGLENVVARWEGAYKVELVNDDDLFLTKTAQVGRNIKTIYQDKTSSTAFENSPVSDDFANMLTNETYTLNIYEEFSKADELKLYIIPELSADKWLRVVTAKYPKQGVKGGHVELVLETVNNDIATSGRAVQQFIQTGGAGEGYAWPVIVNKDTIALDDNRLRDVPVTTMQLEVAGSFPLTTLYAYGRPTIRDDNGGTIFNPRIEAPRLLLPLRIETPTPSPQNTRPTAVSDYYVGNFLPTQWRNHADWRERLVGDTYYDARAKDEGLLISEENKSVVVASNPLSQGTRQYLLWDNAWIFNVDKIYDTSPDAYTEDSLELKGDYTIPELLSHNYFGVNPIEALPKEITSNISFGFRDIPIIGAFLNFATGGINPKFNNQAYRFGTGAIPMIIPADTVEYGNVLMGRGADDTSQETFMPMDIFSGKGSGVETEVNSDIQSQGTIFRTQLTHRFAKLIGGQEYVFDTKDLAQAHPTIDDNGKVVPLPPAKLLWDNTCYPTGRGDVQGYAIDLYGFKGIGKYDYRMSFYSNDTPVFQGTYQTQARFTGSNRDWNNTVKLTNWSEDSNKQVSYPQAIVQPDPPTTNNPRIDIVEFDANNLSDEALITISENVEDSDRNVNNYIGFFNENETRTEKIATFDTTPYGGLNNFRNNYETITFDLTTTTRDQVNPQEINPFTTNFIVDIDTLISNGGQTLSVIDANRVWSYTYSMITNLGTNSRLQTADTSRECNYIITINNNLIELAIEVQKSLVWSSTADLPRTGAGQRFDPTWTTNRFIEFYQFSNTHANPKEINTSAKNMKRVITFVEK